MEHLQCGEDSYIKTVWDLLDHSAVLLRDNTCATRDIYECCLFCLGKERLPNSLDNIVTFFVKFSRFHMTMFLIKSF